MNQVQLPLTHPWTLAFVAHSEDRVIVHLSARTWQCLSLAEDYVLDSAAFDAKLTNGGGVAYYIRPERWAEVCKKVGLAQSDPGQAIFDAWLEWTEGTAVPLERVARTNGHSREFMAEYSKMLGQNDAAGLHEVIDLPVAFNYPRHPINRSDE